MVGIKKNKNTGTSPRQLRVGEEIRHILAATFERGDVLDATGNSVKLTITEVRMTPDLKTATVFYTPLGQQEMAGLKPFLRTQAPALRHAVARNITLRYTPALRFLPDDSFIEAARIDALLRKPEVARDLQ